MYWSSKPLLSTSKGTGDVEVVVVVVVVVVVRATGGSVRHKENRRHVALISMIPAVPSTSVERNEQNGVASPLFVQKENGTVTPILARWLGEDLSVTMIPVEISERSTAKVGAFSDERGPHAAILRTQSSKVEPAT